MSLGRSIAQPQYGEYGMDVDPSLPETSTLLFEAHDYRTSRPQTSESSTLCGLVDLLHRIGHWRLSRKFAEQLSFLLKETQS